MKKLLALLLAFACVFGVSCVKVKQLNCTVDELFDKICKANAEGEMYAYSADRIAEIGIAPDLYESGRFMVPEETAGVETVAFFKAKSDGSAKTIKAALEAFVKATQVDQKDYNADNYKVALEAVVVECDNYVYLVMSSAKAAILKVIDENLK